MKILKISMAFLMAFCATKALYAQNSRVEFSQAFAPSDNWTKTTEQPYRQSICLNGTWQFQPIDLPPGFKEGIDPVPALPDFSENDWDKVPVRIPSPWNVNSFADKGGQGGDFICYPSYPKKWENIKMGWLRKKFTVPASWKGKQIQIHFEAVAGDAEILINGKEAGHHFGIFLPFDVDITDQINFGKENEICVGIRKPSLFDRRSNFGRRTYQAGSFWGQHIAGIWQDVFVVALSETHIKDVYIKPLVDSDRLDLQVAVTNSSNKDADYQLSGDIYPWLSKAGKDPISAPIPSSEVGKTSVLSIPVSKIHVKANSTINVNLSVNVKGRLNLWSPDTPNLYGLILHINNEGQTIDSKYSRFGWRQTTIKGKDFLLNGKPIVLKGDSWHFLGIPQMTRRYAWGWFKALQDAHLNAVRLHAEPYPSLYLDMADEMGIMVLDETAMWASDGGPKLDDPAYWKDSENHLAELVLRDRNHPSIFGWSVSNEIMPVVRGVMHNPPGMKENLVAHYSIWADICRELDPSRPWISADGEDDGDGRLPMYIVHYGGFQSMDRGEKSSKPWGVGEAGNAYYGTPEQVAATNGDRAYASVLGRMEGVAASSYQSLIAQRERHAAYRSVFNLIWYGLQPLALGMKDTTRVPELTDGIFFGKLEEGVPGVQPERLGPYCTTLNPGYDPNLPLYKTWPLFDAIRDASAEPLITANWSKVKPMSMARVADPLSILPATVTLLSGQEHKFEEQFKALGLSADQLVPILKDPSLVIIDGLHPPDAETRTILEKVWARGGKVIVWGAAEQSLKRLNALLPAQIGLTNRAASSFVLGHPNVVTSGIGLSDLYFSELNPADVMTTGLTGTLIQQSEVILEACNTDWQKWNKQPEYAKTAMVFRSEREAKPSGVIFTSKKMDKGELIITTWPLDSRLLKVQKVTRKMLNNLGLGLSQDNGAGAAIQLTGTITHTLVGGGFTPTSATEALTKNTVDPSKGANIKADAIIDGRPWTSGYSEKGTFDLDKLQKDNGGNSVQYLSFWVSSPRSLEDLLLEPNIPTANLEIETGALVQVWLNGNQIMRSAPGKSAGSGKLISDPLKLRLGWNHFLIKIIRTDAGQQFNGKFTSNQPEFIKLLDSALEKP